MNRMRATATVLATAGLLTAAQLGLAGGAFAAAKAPQSAGCPVDLFYPSRFYIDSHGWVTNGGLYFGIKNLSTTKAFRNVSLTITDMKNIRFGSARATGGKVTHKTSTTVTVGTGTLNKKASLGVKVQTHLLNTRAYQVKFTLRGSGWTCAVNQGTWGN